MLFSNANALAFCFACDGAHQKLTLKAAARNTRLLLRAIGWRIFMNRVRQRIFKEPLGHFSNKPPHSWMRIHFQER